MDLFLGKSLDTSFLGGGYRLPFTPLTTSTCNSFLPIQRLDGTFEIMTYPEYEAKKKSKMIVGKKYTVETEEEKARRQAEEAAEEERKAAEAETQRMAAIEAENEVLAKKSLEDERIGSTSPIDVDL